MDCIRRFFSYFNFQEKTMELKIEFQDWWRDQKGNKRNSALLKDGTDLPNLKKQFISELIQRNIITEKDVDERDKVLHMDLNGNQTLYDTLNGAHFSLTSDCFDIRPSYVSVNVRPNVHFTLFYKHNLQHSEQIKEIIEKILKK